MQSPNTAATGSAPAGLDGPRRALLVLDVLLAVGAAGGSWGLISGAIDASSYVRSLPFRSPVFGGVALALVVGVPATVAAVATWTGRRWSAVAQLVAGGMLMGWIVVQIAFIGLISWLQPVMFVWGGAIALLGELERRRVR